MFGMLLDEADTMRVCGIRKDVEVKLYNLIT